MIDEELITLISTASAARLLEILQGSNYNSNDHHLEVRPVFYLPLNKLISDRGSSFAIDKASALLSEVSDSLEIKFPIEIVIDYWSGATSYIAIVDALDLILKNSGSSLGLTVRPPSSAEIEAIASQLECSISDIFNDQLSIGLKKLNISTIISRNNPAELMLATDHCFKVAIYQNLDQASLQNVIDDLIALNNNKVVISNLLSWSPLPIAVSQKLDCGILSIFRATTLARILLPSTTTITLPYFSIERDIAQLSPLFGVTDLGCVAVDSYSAAALKLPTLSKAQKDLAIQLVRAKISLNDQTEYSNRGLFNG